MTRLLRLYSSAGRTMLDECRILVAYKKSRYERYILDQGDPQIAALLAQGHISVQQLQSSHQAHQRSLDELVAHLDDQEVDFDLRYRGDVASGDPYDLVVAVGGDGTVLDLSHGITTTPILSINSDPDASIGYFSAGTAFDFPRILKEFGRGALKAVELNRFRVAIDGDHIGPPVLNDILVAHSNPAAVSTYFFRIGSHPAERQKSSGIWITTPAGTTAAIRSAGGIVLPFDSGNLEYLVREPFPPRQGGYRFLRGIQPFSDPLEVISCMPDGKIFIDGPHLRYDFPIGTTLTVDPDAPRLTILGIQEERRTG